MDFIVPTLRALQLQKSPCSQAALLVVVTILVLFARRPDQFLHPYIWVEDGPFVLKAYAEHGLLSILEPVQGYHILISKLIALSSFKLSILWAPEIELVLAVAFTATVIVAIALSPTHLPWPFACALAALLVPSDPEVFTAALYTFWWAGLLLLLSLLWDADRCYASLRWLYIVIGGLSSPLIFPVSALLALRAAVEKRRSEVLASCVALLIATIQAATVIVYADVKTSHVTTRSILVGVKKYFGYFFIGLEPLGERFYFVSVLLAVLMVIAILQNRSKFGLYFFLLVLSYLMTLAMTVVRVPPDAPHPLLAGPRYFFYPFTLLSWIIIWTIAKSSGFARSAIAAMFFGALLLASPLMSRRHVPISWKDQMRACATSETYNVPIHFTGQLSYLWHVTLSGEQCRKLMRDSLF